MFLRVEKRAAVVPRDHFGTSQSRGARSAEVGKSGSRHVKNLSSDGEPSGEVGVLEPEFEVLVPASNGIEHRPTHEQACPRRPVDGDRLIAGGLQALHRVAQERRRERGRARESMGEVHLLRSTVGGIHQSARSRDRGGAVVERPVQHRDRLVGREHVVVQEQNELRGAGLSPAVVGEREPFRPLDADDLDLRAGSAYGVGGTVLGSVVDDDDALEQRRVQSLDALDDHFARVPRRDDRVDHTGLIPSPAVWRLISRTTDVHLRSGPQMLQYRALARSLAQRNPGRVLDWGCGYGQVTALLREEGIDVVPFDYREGLESPTVAPLERFPGIDVHLSSDSVVLPFDDEAFDTVLSCGVLEHVQDPDASLEEIRRVLRPGGMFYVTNLPNRYSYTERVARLLGLYYHGRLPNDRVYTRGTARELLERHRFQIQEIRLVHMLPLTLGGPARPIWTTSRALERVPGLNLAATSLEVVAVSGR